VQTLIYGVSVEQLEYRFGENERRILVWDFDAMVGNDVLKLVLQKRSRDGTSSNDFETAGKTVALQKPISDFFLDAAVACMPAPRPDGPDGIIWWSASKGLRSRSVSRSTQIFTFRAPVGRFRLIRGSADKPLQS